MKLLKILTMVLFSLLLAVSVSFTQENNTTENGAAGTDTGSAVVTEAEKSVAEEIKPEPVKPVIEQAVKTKTVVPVNKNENRKTADKKNTEKTTAVNSTEAAVENITPVKLDGELLPINEGNFKYKRIPEIKLVEIIPETVVLNPVAAETSGSAKDTGTGFLGLSETASDVIVKGGFLLLILIIFVLYKSRMTGPGKKSSKKRNVLNSYRK